MALDSMDWGVSPTHFHYSVTPCAYRERISVVFDGIDTHAVPPDTSACTTLSGKTPRTGDDGD